MKKLLLTFLLIGICAPTVFAYSHSMTDENGKVIYDVTCDGSQSERYFICTDNLTGNVYQEPKRTRTVEDVYINGKHQRVVKEQYGDKVYITY